MLKIHTKRASLHLLKIPAPPLEPIVVERKRAMTVLVEKVKEDHKKKLLPSHLNNNKVNKLNADINQVYDTIFSLGEILDVLKNTATEYVIRHFDTFVLAFHSFYK